MAGICVVIRKPPYGSLSAAEGIRHFLGAAGCGTAATAVLVDDGVYLAKDGHHPADSGWTDLSAALRKTVDLAAPGSPVEIRIYAHRPSTQERGINRADLVAGVELIDNDQLADMLATAEGTLIF